VIALDTNLLIYAHRAGASRHGDAKDSIQRAADSGPWGIASPVIGEFWSQVTHSQYPGGPSTPVQASGFLHSLTTAGARVLLPRPTFVTNLVRLATELQVSGVRIFDLQIAVVALAGGATELWTYDARFTEVPGLRIVRLDSTEL